MTCRVLAAPYRNGSIFHTIPHCQEWPPTARPRRPHQLRRDAAIVACVLRCRRDIPSSLPETGAHGDSRREREREISSRAIADSARPKRDSTAASAVPCYQAPRVDSRHHRPAQQSGIHAEVLSELPFSMLSLSSIPIYVIRSRYLPGLSDIGNGLVSIS